MCCAADPVSIPSRALASCTDLAVQPLLVDDTGGFRIGGSPDNLGGVVRPREVDLCIQNMDKSSSARRVNVDIDLGHDDELLAREVELLDRLPKDDLGKPVRVYLQEKRC